MKYSIAVIGLGYVGAPLWHALSQSFTTIGYDVNRMRVEELNRGFDSTGEIDDPNISHKVEFCVTDKLSDLRDCNVYIFTVPTPIDSEKRPDLTMLEEACASVGKLLNKGDLVIFESTVYPGCTEEICIPLLEKYSNLEHLLEFNVGYSPERINPGDKVHGLKTVTKIVSADSEIALSKVSSIYERIITAGVYRAQSIRVAEAAKVIENTQRDVNIALMNELAMLFEKMGLDTTEVLQAAATKWNFLPFKPGLVGGHCIGVDPYYLSHKARSFNFSPKMILGGRDTNERVVDFLIDKVQHEYKATPGKKDIDILIMGATFKENVPDFRNSKAIELAHKLANLSYSVHVHDPFVHLSESQFLKSHEVRDITSLKYNLIIISVAHDQYVSTPLNSLKRLLKPSGKIYDLKSIYPKDELTYRL